MQLNRSVKKVTDGSDNNNNMHVARLKQQKRSQRKITLIIATDMLCWLPVLVISGLHMGQVVDATPYYGALSVIVLPINSIINPLLYSDSVYGKFEKWERWGRNELRGLYSSILMKLSTRTMSETVENIEMQPVQKTE